MTRKTCTLSDVVGGYSDSRKNYISVDWDGARILTFALYKFGETPEKFYGKSVISIDIQTGLTSIKELEGVYHLPRPTRPLKQMNFSCVEQNKRISCKASRNHLVVKITREDTDTPQADRFVSSSISINLSNNEVKINTILGDVSTGQEVSGVAIVMRG